MRALERALALTLALCFGFGAAVVPAAAQVEALHPQNWAYEELEHFETRGLIHLHGFRPYSRSEVRRWVEELGEKKDELKRVERQRLARLESEFVTGADPAQANLRFDPPLLRYTEDAWSLAGDVAVSGGGARALSARSGPAKDGTAWGQSDFDVIVRYKDWIAYETLYRVSLEEEAGERTDENAISSRERNWRGLTSNNERAYVAIETERLRLSIGRDFVAWGARRGEELLVSNQAQSLDALQARLRLGRFQLATVTGLLSSLDNRYYGAHRLEISLGSVQLGVQESVVYVSQHVEPTYLFPLSYYYGNQFNESLDDNVMLGLDVKWSTPVGLLSGEFLMDDFIYDGDPAPNKLGVHVDWARAFAPWGTDVDLRVGYTAIGRWTYTHRLPGNAYAHGSGDLASGEELLGHVLGPDADRFRAALSWTPDVRWNLGLEFTRTRRGAGNFDLSGWEFGEPHDLPFPSGDVRHETGIASAVRLRLTRRAEFLFRSAFLSAEDDESAELSLGLRLDF
jgi:hypothetical protein